MPIIYDTITKKIKIPVGFVCNKCGGHFKPNEPMATLSFMFGGEDEISTYCERCYEGVVLNNEIEPISSCERISEVKNDCRLMIGDHFERG
jgi:hypothetical protein